jgi:hypothetical protein
MSNHSIRKITPDGAVSTIAGVPGSSGFADTTNGPAKFYLPQGIAVDNATNIYVADTSNHTIRKITPDGTVKHIGTNGAGPAGGPILPPALSRTLGADDNGNVYVAVPATDRKSPRCVT